MADISTPSPGARDRLRRVDGVWLAVAALLALVALFAPGDFLRVTGIMLTALGHTAVFITFAVLAVAYMKEPVSRWHLWPLPRLRVHPHGADMARAHRRAERVVDGLTGGLGDVEED
ncbi:MAG: hypothetical protein AAF281_09870, partial [Pseudomonadota bacterium]